MKDLILMIAVIIGGVIAIRLYTRTMKPNSATPSALKISPEDVREKLDGDDPVLLLDVRTEDEFSQGHLPGAVNLPVNEILSIPLFTADKDGEIIVYCQSGARSARAAKKLANMGYTHLYDMGGITVWPYEITRE